MSNGIKICICGCDENDLKSLSCYDDGTQNNYYDENNHYAYNLYQCLGCGSILLENVWDNPGLIILHPNGNIERLGNSTNE